MLKNTKPKVFKHLMEMAGMKKNEEMRKEESSNLIYSIRWLRRFHHIREEDFSDAEITNAWTLLQYFCFDVPQSESASKNKKLK
jgi:hypothetical protein